MHNINSIHLNFYFMCRVFCRHACLWTTCVQCPKRPEVLDPLEQMAVGCHDGAEDWTRVLEKGSQSSSGLSLLSGLHLNSSKCVVQWYQVCSHCCTAVTIIEHFFVSSNLKLCYPGSSFFVPSLVLPHQWSFHFLSLSSSALDPHGGGLCHICPFVAGLFGFL